MSGVQEDILGDRLSASTQLPDDSDWLDVLRRADLRPSSHGPRRRRGIGLIAAACSVLLVAAASAAAGLIDVGTVIPQSRQQADGLRYTSDRTVVATGSVPDAGRWRMTVADSDAGPCLGLELLDIRASGMGEGCGEVGSFTAASVAGGSDLPHVRLIFGRADEDTAEVRVTARGFELTRSTEDGPSSLPGDFYLVEIPIALRDVLVIPLDANGRAEGPGIYVPGTLRYLRASRNPERPH